MSEFIALARLASSSSRRLIGFTLLFALIGIAIGVLVDQVFNEGIEKRQPYAAVFFVWSFIPAGFVTLLLFDFSSGETLGSVESNFSDWILRSPIRTWKIALVPILMKTAWICCLWIAFKTLVGWYEPNRLPIIIPCLTMSSLAIWITAIASRPFRYPWLRLASMGVACVAMLGILIGYFSLDHLENPAMRPATSVVTQTLAVVSYVLSVAMTVRWIDLARTSPDGITDGGGSWAASWLRWETADTPIRHRSGPHALMWYDFARTRDQLWKVLVIGVLPTLLIGILVCPLNAITVTFAIVLFMCFAGIAIAGNVAAGETTNSVVLSSLLSRSPIDDATLAWSRFATMMTISAGLYSLIHVLFFGWSLWPSNRQAWLQWAADAATRLDPAYDSVSVGVRLSIMIVMSATMMIGGLTAGFWWASVSGKDWIAIVAATVGISVIMTGLIGFSLWFARQTNWDSTQASLRQMAGWIPPIFVTLMISKTIAAAWVSAALHRNRIASAKAILKVAAIWCVIAIGGGSLMATLNPTPFLTTLHCFALPLMVTPLASVLILPIAVGWDRHR